MWIGFQLTSRHPGDGRGIAPPFQILLLATVLILFPAPTSARLIASYLLARPPLRRASRAPRLTLRQHFLEGAFEPSQSVLHALGVGHLEMAMSFPRRGHLFRILLADVRRQGRQPVDRHLIQIELHQLDRGMHDLRGKRSLFVVLHPPRRRHEQRHRPQLPGGPIHFQPLEQLLRHICFHPPRQLGENPIIHTQRQASVAAARPAKPAPPSLRRRIRG